MDYLEGITGVRRIVALGLASALASCSPQSSAGTGVAAPQKAPTLAESPAPQSPSTTPGSGAGTHSSPSRDAAIDSVGGAASSVPDASVADASRSDAAGPIRGAAGSTEDAAAASGADAGAAPGAGCEGSTFALCEDFESGMLDTKLWKLTQSKGTVTLDASRAARGSTHSVHVHVEPGTDTMVGLTESRTFPALKSGLFARAFIFIPNTTTSSLLTGDRHSRLIYAQGANPEGEYALGIWNGGLIQNHYSTSDDSQNTKLLPPFDQWFCLEYELDSAAGNVKAYLNDMEITALRHEGWPAANIDTLMFGVDRYGSFPVAEDIWFDDLVVDSRRIGCSR